MFSLPLSRVAIVATTLLLTPLQAEAFPELKDFFHAHLKEHVSLTSEIKIAPAVDIPEQVKTQVDERNRDQKRPAIFKLSFQVPEGDQECFGALIKESPRLSVSGLPKEFHDRAGMVYIGHCHLNDNPLLFEKDWYQVFPLEKTLPLGNMTVKEAYNLFEDIKNKRPDHLCTDNDMNAEGVPRSQLAIHEEENTTTFYTGISRSSPPREVDGEVIWSDDRAMFAEWVDQSSLPEVRAALDFMSLKLEGRLFFSFHNQDCYKAREDGMTVMTCEATLPKERELTYQPVKEYSEVPLRLKKVKVTLQSNKVKRLLLGPQGNNQIIEDLDFKITYSFGFLSEKGPRYLKVRTTWGNTELDSTPECRQVPES